MTQPPLRKQGTCFAIDVMNTADRHSRNGNLTINELQTYLSGTGARVCARSRDRPYFAALRHLNLPHPSGLCLTRFWTAGRCVHTGSPVGACLSCRFFSF